MTPAEFQGLIGRTYEESTPWWPDAVRAPAGAPDVVLIVLDDVGFAQLGCFGSDIATPALDALARNGLRYSNFHTTALCSPTRACLLTGRNHHVNGMGRIVELATGFPGYNARIPKENGFLSEMLLPQGYATLAVGKWHLTPEDETHLAAPRHRWPLGRGFERFYGFMEGETHQFVPDLVCDNHQVQPPRTYEEGYHLTEDLVDRALEYVGDVAAIDPNKPWFLYFCTGACHSPHQSPAGWIERYRGRFDDGWDAWRQATLQRQVELGVIGPDVELSPRPDWVPAWASLSADERRLYARFMEAFAAFLSHTDEQIGRLVRGLGRLGRLDNTLLLVLSDNGASSEGGPTGSVNDVRPWNLAERTLEEALARIDEIGGPRCHNNYPWGWTVAGNTPFRRWKREVHEGGVADPLIVHWPARITARGEVRRQYVHAIDIAPTVLDALGGAVPDTLGGVDQRPLDGASFAATFADASALGPRLTQHYEMFGCRAIHHDGWKAVTYHPIQDTRRSFADDAWELYDVTANPSECHDLAAAQPDKLEEMVQRWWAEAERHQVLPLDNRVFSAFVLERPPPVPPRDRYVYRPGATAVPEAVAANVRNRSHRLVVTVELGIEPVEGVLLAQGSLLGGWSFHVLDGRLRYVHNLSGLESHAIGADERLTQGHHELCFRFTKTGEHQGVGTLLVDGEPVGEGTIPRFTPNRFSLTGAGLSCGYSDGLPVTDEYPPPFRFTGTIVEAAIEVGGEPYLDAVAEAEIAVLRQ